MVHKYGKTWWGQQWLNALEKIDYSNRLPRGRNYASKGAVKSIDIKKNVIMARVAGSRPSPYKVKMTVPLFSTIQQNQLLESILSNRILLSRLLNRELPGSLLKIAREQNIQIFPQSWQDIEMKCSCPDWAVPCKHIASVVYILANSIDENPFLVFELHGFDIIKALDKEGIKVEELKKEKIPELSELFADTASAQTAEDTIQHELPDFTQLPDMSGFLGKLLVPNPIFYDRDFREIIDQSLKKLSRFSAKFQHPVDDKGILMPLGSSLLLMADEDLILDARVLDDEGNVDMDHGLMYALVHLERLASENRFVLYDASFQLLWDMFGFVQALMVKAALVPRLLSVEPGVYTIQWIPARMDADVRNQCEHFENRLARISLVYYMGDSSENNTIPFRPEEQLNLFCSNLVRVCFMQCVNLEAISMPGYGNWHPLISMFFAGHIIDFGPNKNSVPSIIHIWLRRLFVVQGNIVPLLRVDEDDAYDGFRVTVDVELKAESQVLTLAEFMETPTLSDQQIPLLRDLALLADYLPDLESALENQQGKWYPAWDFENVLLEILPLIKMLGISIALPPALKHLIRPTAGLRVKEKQSRLSQSFTSLTEILDYDWGVALGDTIMDEQDFFKLVGSKQGLVKFRNSYLLVSQEDMEKLHKQLTRKDELSSLDLLRATLAEEHENAPVLISEEVKRKIKGLLTPEKLDVPEGIRATLRPYQLAGYQWLVANSKLGLGSLIADDMGMGKTIQVIAALQHFKDSGLINAKRKALVVAPTSLLSNWQKELEKFAPGLIPAIYHGAQRALPADDYDVLLTSYGLARNDHDILSKPRWYALIIDESQAIKNPSAEQTKAIKKIKADVKIAMSGTPVENRLSDYWSVFDFINKGYLGGLKSFQEKFANPIQKDHDRQKAEVFRRATRPFLLRRLKTDKSIISDLPDKIENTLFCSLTPEQAAIYESLVQSVMEQIEKSEGIERRGLVLKMMTALKQICNHPVHYLKKGLPLAGQSGKAQLLLSLLDNVLINGEKTLIFTQYKEMGDLLTHIIQEQTGVLPLFLHGGLSRKKRDELVNDFQHKPYHKIFILSLKAGGTGLNLTAATNVIHYDLWWNPAVEAQATDRAYRIGQKNNVMVYRPLCKGTFEERIDEMLKVKKELADITVDTGEAWIGELSDNELRDLVKLQK